MNTSVPQLQQFLRQEHVSLHGAPRLRPAHHLTAEQRRSTIALAESLPPVTDMQQAALAAARESDPHALVKGPGGELWKRLLTVTADADELLLSWVYDVDRYRWWSRQADEARVIALLARAAAAAQHLDRRTGGDVR